MAMLKVRLTGAWNLQEYRAISVDDSGDIIHPLGPHCKGQAIFSADSYMSALVQEADTTGFAEAASVSDRELATRRTIAHSGPYLLNDITATTATLSHVPDISLPDSWTGSTLIRHIELTEDSADEAVVGRLTLATVEPITIGTRRRQVEMSLRRAPVPNSMHVHNPSSIEQGPKL